MLKVVLDTNVLLSAILFGGKPRQILEAAFEGSIRTFVSQAMIDELQNVLDRPKFGFTSQISQSIVSEIASIAEWIKPTRHHAIVKEDPSDNDILDCAIEAKADYLVTGDNHLLRQVECSGVEIVNPDKFLGVLINKKE
jgi:putative PIN family toxin of toxin-antitoxin system